MHGFTKRETYSIINKNSRNKKFTYLISNIFIYQGYNWYRPVKKIVIPTGEGVRVEIVYMIYYLHPYLSFVSLFIYLETFASLLKIKSENNVTTAD